MSSPSIPYECPICRKTFFVYPYRLRAAPRLFCSRACQTRWQTKSQQRLCTICQQPFTVTLGKIKEGKGQFCSVPCAALSRSTAEERTCQLGKTPFKVTPSRIHKGEGKFCSATCAREWFSPPADQKFYANVHILDPPFFCWLYLGSNMTDGYGVLITGGQRILAHRWAYEHLVGPIPEGLSVLHNCPMGDNPACIFPGHLFLGTRGDNATDMARKGRASKGEARPTAKLTEALVREIRKGQYKRGQDAYWARKLGLSHGTIHLARIGQTWKHVQ